MPKTHDMPQIELTEAKINNSKESGFCTELICTLYSKKNIIYLYCSVSENAFHTGINLFFFCCFGFLTFSYSCSYYSRRGCLQVSVLLYFFPLMFFLLYFKHYCLLKSLWVSKLLKIISSLKVMKKMTPAAFLRLTKSARKPVQCMRIYCAYNLWLWYYWELWFRRF